MLWAIPLLGAAMQMKGNAMETEASIKASLTNAKIAEKEGAAKAVSVRKQSRKAAGSIKANIAKSGITRSGSALRALEESVAVGERDALVAEWSAGIESDKHKSNAKYAGEALPYRQGATLLQGATQSAMLAASFA